MIIDKINLNHLRIFECVFRTKSMTTAARELHLTQSGVSQHMKSFEDVLGLKLFDRINQRLVPTAAAAHLYERCSSGLRGIEDAFLELKGGQRELAGTVSIGTPIEFGNNILMPLLTQFCRKHPQVKLKLKLDFASAMNTSILRGDIDFAFVDEFNMDKRISTEKVYDEVLDLCVAQDYLKKFGSPKHLKKFYESLDYVEYQEEEPLLRMWFAHHLSTKHINLNVKAVVMDVQGVSQLILNGMGAGILPGHLALKLSQEGRKIYSFKGCGKPLKNAISVAYLRERTYSPAASAILEWLKGSLGAQHILKKESHELISKDPRRKWDIADTDRVGLALRQ